MVLLHRSAENNVESCDLIGPRDPEHLKSWCEDQIRSTSGVLCNLKFSHTFSYFMIIVQLLPAAPVFLAYLSGDRYSDGLPSNLSRWPLSGLFTCRTMGISPAKKHLLSSAPRTCLTSRLAPRRIVRRCRISQVRESSAPGPANYFLMWRRFFWRACFLADQIPLKGSRGVLRGPRGSTLWQATPAPEGGLVLHPACREALLVGRRGDAQAPALPPVSALFSFSRHCACV